MSLDYFTETNRVADFIVREEAHVFHNCKRLTVGLLEAQRREWLLEIAFQKRETFAYGCEAFSRVVALCPKIKDRPAMIEQYAQTFTPSDALIDLLRAAVQARNGWKIILARRTPRRERCSTRSTSSSGPTAVWHLNNTEPAYCRT